VKAVLTLTLNPSLDVTTSVDEVRHRDKLRCTSPKTDPGGGGINVARVITRLGGATKAIVTAGGPNGRTLEELLAEEGIAAEAVHISGLTRQSLTVFERSTHEQYRFVMPGPDLDAKAWQQCLDQVAGALAEVDYLVASGSLPLGVPTDAYARIARIARERGVRMILDTSGEALAAAMEEPVYLIKPNVRELRALVGDKSLDENGLVSFAKELVSAGKCEIVALTLGERGAVLVARDQVVSIAPPPIEVQSAVGAGDSFVGALTLALVQGNDLGQTLRYGVAAGTAALLTHGTELCWRKDVDRLFRELGVQ
jgi:6-phosphofructokinase 2